eukprot:3692578-Pleurochrysis_carterae.AAC.2
MTAPRGFAWSSSHALPNDCCVLFQERKYPRATSARSAEEGSNVNIETDTTEPGTGCYRSLAITGTLLSTPLNVLVELVWHGTVPAPPEAVGIAAICGGFAAIMYDDYKRDIVNNALAPAAESPVAARGETESLDRSAQT